MRRQETGYTLVEVSIVGALIGVVGLVVYSILMAGTVLGAKNTAANTAHQQARVAMLEMIEDLHAAISLPQLVDSSGNPLAGVGPAAGISFQMWSGGPYKVAADASNTQNQVQITLPASAPAPTTTQRLIVPTHQIEDDITAVTQNSSTLYTLTLSRNLANSIAGTGSPSYYNIVCYIADRCSYVINNRTLQWNGPTSRRAASIIGQDITAATPFTMPSTPLGAIYYRSVAAIDLSTSDLAYSNRGFKSANILLNGQVPMRARLTTFQ